MYRSRQLDVSKWVDRLQTYKEKLERDQVSRTSWKGSCCAWNSFLKDIWHANMDPVKLASGSKTSVLKRRSRQPWGITVIEGGAEMDEYPRAALLSLLASILYSDAVARRRAKCWTVNIFPPMQIFFEEANKVLTGVSGEAASDQGSERIEAIGQPSFPGHVAGWA